MKYYLGFILLIYFVSFTAFSQHVTVLEAGKAAARFYLENYSVYTTDQGKTAKIKESRIKKFNNHDSYFIHYFDDGSWVVTSSNYNTKPIIAYSFGKNSNLNLEGSPGFAALMSIFDTIIDYSYGGKYSNENNRDKWEYYKSFQKSAVPSVIHVEPMIKTFWSQSITNDLGKDPYTGEYVCGYNYQVDHFNSGCDCGRCFAGCTSVAMSQLMNYWGYSNGVNSDFNWWGMPSSLNYYGSGNYVSPDFEWRRNAVSYLISRVGNQCGANYCISGCQTSAQLDKAFTIEDARGALDHFGYNSSTMELHHKIFYSYNSWVDMLKEELDAGRPILYFVPFHIFICDGYGDDHRFHFNFGWLGNHEAWWDFEDVDSAIPGLFSNVLSTHNCITGIKPEILFDRTFTNTTCAPGENVTYQVVNSIVSPVSGNNFVIQSTAKARFIAGTSITLKPGFVAHSGSEFLAKVFILDPLKNNLKSGMICNDDEFIIGNNIVTIHNEKGRAIKIFPNPANSIIQVDFGSASFKQLSYAILNLNGIICKDGTFGINSEANSIDISQLSSGAYILQLQTEFGTMNQFFIKY